MAWRELPSSKLIDENSRHPAPGWKLKLHSGDPHGSLSDLRTETDGGWYGGDGKTGKASRERHADVKNSVTKYGVSTASLALAKETATIVDYSDERGLCPVR